MENKIIKKILKLLFISNIFFTINAEYVRPEASSYSVNNYSVQNMFDHNYKERIKTGKSWFINRQNYEETNDTLQRNSINNKIKNLTMGIEFFSFDMPKNKKLTLGVFAGMGSSSGEAKELIINKDEQLEEKLLSSKHIIDGYSAGINGTYINLINDNNEIFFDGWILGGYFKEYVKGKRYDLEKYKQNLFMGSLELGLKHKLSDHLYISPRIQVVKSILKAKEHKETNFTRVSFKGNDNTKNILGLRLSTEEIIIEGDTNKELKGYIEYNYTINSKEPNITMNDDKFIAFHNKRVNNLKVGASILFGDNLYIYSDLNYTFTNKKSKRNIDSKIGFRYLF